MPLTEGAGKIKTTASPTCRSQIDLVHTTIYNNSHPVSLWTHILSHTHEGVYNNRQKTYDLRTLQKTSQKKIINKNIECATLGCSHFEVRI